jgi:TPR repeat protein
MDNMITTPPKFSVSLSCLIKAIELTDNNKFKEAKEMLVENQDLLHQHSNYDDTAMVILCSIYDVQPLLFKSEPAPMLIKRIRSSTIEKKQETLNSLESMVETIPNSGTALYSVGWWFDHVEEKYEEAVKWYKMSSDKGNSNAQYALGWCYYNGKGVKQDYEEAVKWYKVSSDQGNSSAILGLGRCYENGKGVKQDDSEAMKWYKMSAEQGNSNAQLNLGWFYRNGKGVKQNYPEAMKWYKMSAEQGNSAAQFHLGVCYENGKGVSRNYREAFRWYKMSSEQDNRNAQYKLGVCYDEGKELNKIIQKQLNGIK